MKIIYQNCEKKYKNIGEKWNYCIHEGRVHQSHNVVHCSPHPTPAKNIYREGRENLYSSKLALWNDVRNAESQPGPQGIPSHFQRKKPWGRGWWKPLITFILTRKTRLANTYQLFLYRPLYYGRLLGRWLFATQLHEKLRKINKWTPYLQSNTVFTTVRMPLAQIPSLCTADLR